VGRVHVESRAVLPTWSRQKSQKIRGKPSDCLPPYAKKKQFPVRAGCRNLVVLPNLSYHLNAYICACTMD
jgi:hypothetical protein